MENATKALLIAAGIFFGLMIISISLVMLNRISAYYQSKEANKVTEQLAAFNKQYTAYNRDDVRGSDILSLVNKIIDFNERREIGAAEMQISIIIPRDTAGKYKYFYYKYVNTSSETLIRPETNYTHVNISNQFLIRANQMASSYGTKIEKLVSNISTLIIDDGLTGILKERAEQARKDLLEQLKIDEEYYTNIDEDILRYYQFQQFKRAHFSCEELTFTKDGRVESFEFEFTGKFE